MHKIALTFFIALASFTLSAQQNGAKIAWDKTNHDFGTIKEELGNVTHKFFFTNTGNQPLVLTHVRPSCGCTSSDYTKAPVKPGEKGYVSATFNPKGRPGKFNKSITVTTNSTPPVTSIRFTGVVTPKPKTIHEEFPRKLGQLNMKSNHIAFMKIANTEIETKSIEVANLGTKDLDISFNNIPKHISIKAEPKVLKPGEKGKITATYDASKKNDWGFLMDRIPMVINGNAEGNKNRISISATISEDFSKLSEKDKLNAPVITFESKVFNFGTIKQGENPNHTFKFKNTGKRDLIIHKTKASCGCTIVKASKEVVKPGETSEFAVTFNSKGKRNRQNKTITVISNDPKSPELTLRITGTVEAQ